MLPFFKTNFKMFLNLKNHKHQNCTYIFLKLLTFKKTKKMF